MHAWEVTDPGPLDGHPLQLTDRDPPEPVAGQIRIKVSVCGVCRTDLHIAEGDLEPRRRPVVPGHEVVGLVDAIGAGAKRFAAGDRVGIAWLRHTCGVCKFCTQGRENLCLEPRFTGYDDDGGYAEFACVPEDYAYSVPDQFDDEHAAPLLCAGIIGYRALKLADAPDGGRLGIYGFGGSAHLTAQVALHRGAELYVMTRGERARALADELGATWVGSPDDDPPVPLDSAIVFAPVGEIVPRALAHLDRGGTCAISGVHLTDVPELEYARHLFYEKRLVSVTANTREDGREFLDIAAQVPVDVSTQPYPLTDANQALLDLKEGRVRGAAVLIA